MKRIEQNIVHYLNWLYYLSLLKGYSIATSLSVLTTISQILTHQPTLKHTLCYLPSVQDHTYIHYWSPVSKKSLLLTFLICLQSLIPSIILYSWTSLFSVLESLLALWQGWNLNCRISLFVTLLLTASHFLINFSMVYLKILFSVLFSSS